MNPAVVTVVHHYMEDQPTSGQLRQHVFPPCHTYSVAVTSSAIKDSSTNNATLFMITTAPTTQLETAVAKKKPPA